MIKKDVGNVTVKVTFVRRVEEPFNQFTKKEEVNKYSVRCLNRDTGKQISFPCYDSIHATKTLPTEYPELMNIVLSCIKMDYHCSSDNYPTFEEFASAFGYDEDSRKAEKIYHDVVKHGDKLNTVFSAELVETFPD